MLHIYKFGSDGKMLIDENKSIFEVIASWWQWIFGVATALVIIWKATKKTSLTGWGIFTVIKRFTDAATALAELKKVVETDRKDHKAELAYLHAKLEILSDGFSTPQFRADEQGNFVDVNEAFCEMFHKTLDELEGDGWTSIFSKDDRASSLAAWDRATSRKVKFSQIFRVICAGGMLRMVKMRARPVYDGDGEFKEIIGSIVLVGKDDV